MVRYVVTENTPGYLPESEPAEFRTLKEAIAYALDLVSGLREGGYKVLGSARERAWYGERNAQDLGRVVEISVEPEMTWCPTCSHACTNPRVRKTCEWCYPWHRTD